MDLKEQAKASIGNHFSSRYSLDKYDIEEAWMMGYRAALEKAAMELRSKEKHDEAKLVLELKEASVS